MLDFALRGAELQFGEAGRGLGADARAEDVARRELQHLLLELLLPRALPLESDVHCGITRTGVIYSYP